MSETYMNELEKIRFHIKLLSEALDVREYPIPSLIIENDWSEKDLNDAHDIFEEFDNKLSSGQTINWYEFEKNFQERLGLGYQRLKSLVLAFFWNGQWIEVCREYAREHHCIEFSEITSNQRGTSFEDKIASIFIENRVKYSREAEVTLDGGKRARLDFLVQFPRAVVAIEVKKTVDENTRIALTQIAKAIKSSNTANEFWVIAEKISEHDRARWEESGLKLVTADELEMYFLPN